MSERIRAYLASAEDNLYRLFLADSPRAYRTALIGLTLLVAAAVALLVLGGPTPQKANANDTFLLLDSGWRIFCGQRPHSTLRAAWARLFHAGGRGDVGGGKQRLCGSPTDRPCCFP